MSKRKRNSIRGEKKKVNKLLDRLKKKKGVSKEEVLQKPTPAEKLTKYMKGKNREDGVGNGEEPGNIGIGKGKGSKPKKKKKGKKNS